MEWINTIINSEQAGISVLFVLFLFGIVSVFSCGCNYAIIGTIAGYTGSVSSTGKTKNVILISIFFLLGTVIAMSIFGCIIGFASELISASLGNFWKIFAGFIAILFGIYTLDILPFKIPGINVNFKNKRNSVIGSIIFGFTIGGILSLCNMLCNPFFPVIMAASFIKGSTYWGILMLFSYSLGYSFTLASLMFGFGLGLGKLSEKMNKFSIVLKYFGGISLIIFGFYFLLTF